MNWREWDRSQVLCRALLAVLPVVAILLPPGSPSLLWLVLVAGTAVGWACLPETFLGVVCVLLVLVWWVRVVDDPLGPATLVAALLLGGAHVAGVLAAYGPARSRLARDLVLLWVRRAALALLPVPVVYAAVVLLDDRSASSLTWPAAALAALVLVVGAGLVVQDGAPPEG